MPANVVKSVARRAGVSTAEVEKQWTRAKRAAAKDNPKQKYALAMHIFKKLVKDHWGITLGEHEALVLVIDEIVAEKTQ